MKKTAAEIQKRKTLSRRRADTETSADTVRLLITKLAEKPATAQTTPHPPQKHQTYSAFLQTYDNERTRAIYQRFLQHYLTFTVSAKPGKPSDAKYYDALAETYLQQLKTGRNPESDLTEFIQQKAKTHAAGTIKGTVLTALHWLDDNGYRLNRLTKRQLITNIPAPDTPKKETQLTKPLLKNIYTQMTKDWAKVLLLILISTGMQLGEALNLKETDIIKTETGTKIRIRAETVKTKIARTAYLTKEAADALNTYLAEKKKNDTKKAEKEHAQNPKLNRQQKIRLEKTGCIFPYSEAAAEKQMREAADKNGCGKIGTPRTVNWHMVRKWFISQITRYAGKEAAEELAGYMGHRSGTYRKMTAEELFAAFKKAEKQLTLFTEEERADEALRQEEIR